MKLYSKDKLNQAEQIMEGLQMLCQLLEFPHAPPLPQEVLVVIECALAKSVELVEEALTLESMN